MVADTHVGEHLPALPPEVAEILEGVDLILHAGDLTDTVVLEELARELRSDEGLDVHGRIYAR